MTEKQIIKFSEFSWWIKIPVVFWWLSMLGYLFGIILMIVGY